jgi:hypothetical protein
MLATVKKLLIVVVTNSMAEVWFERRLWGIDCECKGTQ